MKKNRKKSENLLINGLLHPFGVRNDEGSNEFAMTNLMFLIINHPFPRIKTVLCVSGVDKNYFGGVLGVVNKGVGLPVKGLRGRVAVGKVGLLVYGSVKAYLVTALFEL